MIDRVWSRITAWTSDRLPRY